MASMSLQKLQSLFAHHLQSSVPSVQTIEKNDTFFTSLGSHPEVHVLCLRLYQKPKALHPNWCSFIAGFVVAELPTWHLCGGTPGAAPKCVSACQGCHAASLRMAGVLSRAVATENTADIKEKRKCYLRQPLLWPVCCVAVLSRVKHISRDVKQSRHREHQLVGR